MIDIISFIKGFVHTNNRKQFILDRITYRFINTVDTKYKIIGTSNAIYYINKYFYLIQQAINEYDYSDIRKTDIVLDIGAALGGFSLEVHKKAKYVFAVEPLFCEKLYANIDLNHANNVTVFECAIGESNTTQNIGFVDKTNSAPCKTLSEIIELCGGHVDFLKIDCEGGEWCIEPHELEGIRRIEAEIHSFNNERIEDFTDMLLSLDYDVKKLNRSKSTQLISARRR